MQQIIRNSLVLLLAVQIAACTLTPAAAERVAVLEVERAELVAERDAIAAQAAGLAAEVERLVGAVDHAEAELAAARAALAAATTAEQVAAAEQLIAARESAAAAAEAELDAATAAALDRLEKLAAAFGAAQAGVDTVTAEIAQVEAEDLTRQAEGAAAPFLPFVPAPYQTAVLAALGLVPWVSSKRSRQHLRRALTELNPLDGDCAPGQALAAIARALGLEHSSEDPAALLEVVRRKAERQGLALIMTPDGPAVVTPTAAERPAA